MLSVLLYVNRLLRLWVVSACVLSVAMLTLLCAIRVRVALVKFLIWKGSFPMSGVMC